MALSRAAAAAARKAAKSRGLKGNRAEDGSMLTASRESHLIEEYGGQEKYRDVSKMTDDEIAKEWEIIQEDINKFEKELDDLHETNYNEFEEGPFNDFAIGLAERQLRELRKRRDELDGEMEAVIDAAQEAEYYGREVE